MKGDNLAHLMRVVRTFVCFFDEYAGCIFKISKSNSESATKGICFVPVSKIENTDVGCSELCNRWINLELPAKYRHNIIYHMKLLKHRQTFKFNVVENNLNWKLHPITSEKYAHQLPFESGLFGQIQFTEINSMNSGGLVMAIMLNCHKIVKFPNLCEDRTFWVGFLFQSLSLYTICISYFGQLNETWRTCMSQTLFCSFVSLHWHTVLVWVGRFPPF